MAKRSILFQRLLAVLVPMFVACSSPPSSSEDSSAGGLGGGTPVAGASSGGVAGGGTSAAGRGGQTNPTGGANSGGAAQGGAGASGAAGAAGEENGGAAGSSEAMIDLGENGKLDIYPVGDSITLGANGGYRSVVFTKLMADGYEVDMLGSLNDWTTSVDDKDHEGHPGMGTGSILESLETWMAGITEPDLVMLMIGTNDLAWDYGRPAPEAAGRLELIIDKLFEIQPTVTVIVASIAPEAPQEVLIDLVLVERADATDEYNALARALVEERALAGERIAFAEVNAALSLDDLSDGIHPTPEGYLKMGDVFYEAARAMLPEP